MRNCCLNIFLLFCFREGDVVTLKEEDSDMESRSEERMRVKKMVSNLHPKSRRSRSRPYSEIKENGTSEKDKEVRRKPYPRKRRLRKARDNNDESNDTGNKVSFILRRPNLTYSPSKIVCISCLDNRKPKEYKNTKTSSTFHTSQPR